MILASGNDEIVRRILLEDQPHGLNKVPGIAPVSLGLEIPEKELILKPELDSRGSAGDLSGNKGLTPSRGFMVEENAVGSKDIIGLTM